MDEKRYTPRTGRKGENRAAEGVRYRAASNVGRRAEGSMQKRENPRAGTARNSGMQRRTGEDLRRETSQRSAGMAGSYANRRAGASGTGGREYGRNAARRTGRTSGRGRRRKAGRPWKVLLPVLFLVLLLGGAAVFGVMVYRKNGENQGKQLLSQISVNLDTLYSPYAILIDRETGTVISSKRGDEKIYPASMVKIMTVLTAIRSIRDLDKKTVMSYDYYDALYAQDASRAGFEPGEEAVIRDLLYGALLPSGAECCMQLALEAAGSEAGFVELMNQNALEMGLTQTHFTNATGLHSTEQYSTPHEIAVILQNALKEPVFRNVFTTHYYTVKPTSVHPDGFTFWSTLFKNTESEAVNGGTLMGGKTGFTGEAGHCLASMAKIREREYILVTAGWTQVESAPQNYHIQDAFLAYNQIAPEQPE